MRTGGFRGALIVVAIIIAVAVTVGTGIYMVSRGDEGAPGEGAPEGIGTADFKVETTAMGQTFTGRVRAKNIGTPNVKYRVEGTVSFIFDVGKDKIWTRVDGWHDSTGLLQSSLPFYQQVLGGWVDQLSGWTGGELNFTDPTTGAPARIYDIVVNPDLPDSLFQP